MPDLISAVAAPMLGRPYPYWVDQLVWVELVALPGLPGHWSGTLGDWVCGTTALAVSIITWRTSFGVSRRGIVPASRALSAADCTIASMPAWNGVAPEVLFPSPEKTLWVP